MLLVARANFVRHDCDMCGRFTRMYTWRELVALYRLTDRAPPSNLQPRYNICPTTQIDAVIERDSKRVLEQMRWGLVPSWWEQAVERIALGNLQCARRNSRREALLPLSIQTHALPDLRVRLLR